MLKACGMAALILTLAVGGTYASTGKALVRVYFDDLEHLKAVVSEFDDVAAWGGKRYADIVVPGDRLGELNAIAPKNEVLIPDVDEHMRRMGVLGVGSAYHTQEEVYADMDSVATAYPDICKLESIGTSIEGRDLWALKISDNVTLTESEPRVLYLGCHHAREVITVEIPLYIMYWLVHNYGTDSLATYLVDNREIWIVPLMNPDGREYVEHTGDWRKNRRNNGDGSYGVDLNRNWGYMWGYDDEGSSPNPSSETYRGSAGFSEPETQAVRDFMLDYQFDACVSYHSYGKLVLWAWGYTYDPCPDNDLFAALGDSMASLNGYTPGPGSNLYLTNGDSDDWMYGEQSAKDKVFSYTFEVGTEFYPPESEIPTLCAQNLEASLLAAEYAGNMLRMLPPGTPVIASMPDDDDGVFTVSWTPDMSDTVNPAVAYALVERTGPSRLTDDVEAGNLYWARSNSGSQSFYGGRTNSRDARLTMAVGMDVNSGDTLTFWTWYDIETDWDYAYVEVSADGGAHYRSIPGSITTTYNPNGSNLGNGITGSSGGWVKARFSLDSVADSTVLVRFRYRTDSYVLGEGIYVDDIFPTQTFDSSAVLNDAIADTHYDLSRPVGTYYYEVKARDADGQWGYWSQRESVTVVGSGIEDIAGRSADEGIKNPVYAGTILRLMASSAPGEQVSIFDVRGRTVRVLRAARSGEMTWDLRDSGGAPVPAGIYFARFDHQARRDTRKIVVLE
jgi:hypothetical protein